MCDKKIIQKNTKAKKLKYLYYKYFIKHFIGE